jgi:hypothetical protein
MSIPAAQQQFQRMVSTGEAVSLGLPGASCSPRIFSKLIPPRLLFHPALHFLNRRPQAGSCLNAGQLAGSRQSAPPFERQPRVGRQLLQGEERVPNAVLDGSVEGGSAWGQTGHLRPHAARAPRSSTGDAGPVTLSLVGVRSIRPQSQSALNESSAWQGPGPTVMVALPVMPLTLVGDGVIVTACMRSGLTTLLRLSG